MTDAAESPPRYDPAGERRDGADHGTESTGEAEEASNLKASRETASTDGTEDASNVESTGTGETDTHRAGLANSAATAPVSLIGPSGSGSCWSA